MPLVLVYFETPAFSKMVWFAVVKVDREIECVVASKHEEAAALLVAESWDMAVVGFEPDDVALVELCAREGIPSLVGVCVDTPEHEVLARGHGATRCWRWPMQVHLLSAVIGEQLSLRSQQ